MFCNPFVVEDIAPLLRYLMKFNEMQKNYIADYQYFKEFVFLTLSYYFN